MIHPSSADVLIYLLKQKGIITQEELGKAYAELAVKLTAEAEAKVQAELIHYAEQRYGV